MNQRFPWIFASFGLVCSISLLSLGLSARAESPASSPAPAAEGTPAQPTAGEPQAELSPAARRLMGMFSPDISRTLAACLDKGGVNLAAGAQSNGSLLCANGDALPAIGYDSYISTISDLMAASVLLGFRSTMMGDRRVSPEMLVNILSMPQVKEVLRTRIATELSRRNIIPSDSPESSDLLTEQIIGRLLPTINSTNNLTDLTGSTEQYQQVVSSFCEAPGMSVPQVQQTLPGLSSVQLYAICVQESGAVEEAIQRTTNP